MKELVVDPDRPVIGTGIYVRAKEGDRFVNADIAQLDKASMLEWLRSRGGANEWAENVVGILLGYGTLHPLRPGDDE
jgi:hypothetical protein